MRANVVVVLCTLSLGTACSKSGPATPPPATPVAVAPPAAEPPATPVAPAPPESDEVTITSKSPEAVEELKKGRELSEQFKGPEAEPHYKKAVELDPDFALATSYLADVSPPTERQKLLERAVELAKNVPEPERMLIEARLAFSNNQREKGTELLRKITAAKPKDARIALLLAQQASAEGNWDEVIRACKAVLAQQPQNAEAYNYLAYGYLGNHQIDEAVAAAKKQIELKPDEPNSYDTLGDIYLQANKLDEADAAFGKSVEKYAQNYEALKARGTIRALRGDWAGANTEMLHALGAAPRPQDKLNVQYHHAWLYGAQGNKAQVLKTYDAMDKSAQAVPELAQARALLAANRGYMLALMGDGKGALKALDEVPALAKETARTEQQERGLRMMVAQARIYAARKLGRGADAEKAYAELLVEAQKEPIRKFDQSNLQLNQGLVALAKKDAKGAVDALSKCIPEDKACRFLLVEAQRAAGDKQGAAKTLSEVKASPVRDGDYVFYATRTK